IRFSKRTPDKVERARQRWVEAVVQSKPHLMPDMEVINEVNRGIRKGLNKHLEREVDRWRSVELCVCYNICKQDSSINMNPVFYLDTFCGEILVF
ncbi:MAG: hypothetical protein CSA89_01455, partial [Bacteroidales bacterium]